MAQNKIPLQTICNISAIQCIHCTLIIQQEAFEKSWAHSPLRAAHSPDVASGTVARRLRIERRQRRQRQRVTEGTAVAPWNGPNHTTV